MPAKKTTAPAATATTDATDATSAPALDLASRLAEGAKQAAELPKATASGYAAPNPLKDLVGRSHAESQVFELPPVGDEKTAKRVHSMLRNAAKSLGLSVEIRNTRIEDGRVVVHFKAVPRKTR